MLFFDEFGDRNACSSSAFGDQWVEGSLPRASVPLFAFDIFHLMLKFISISGKFWAAFCVRVEDFHIRIVFEHLFSNTSFPLTSSRASSSVFVLSIAEISLCEFSGDGSLSIVTYVSMKVDVSVADVL